MEFDRMIWISKGERAVGTRPRIEFEGLSRPGSTYLAHQDEPRNAIARLRPTDRMPLLIPSIASNPITRLRIQTKHH
jgi:hypothetical protein